MAEIGQGPSENAADAMAVEEEGSFQWKKMLPAFPTPFTTLSTFMYGTGERAQCKHEMHVASFEGSVCDKPSWWEKIFDDAIVAKWRSETARGLSDEAFGFAMAELKWRATRWPGPSRPAAVEGVFGADDYLLSPEELAELQAGVARLEAVQGDNIDWHPGSDMQVRDLVHPSLCCYRRGRTLELTPSPVLSDPNADIDAEIPTLSTIGRAGVPSAVPEGLEKPAKAPRYGQGSSFESKTGLVWLPSEFQVRDDGSVRIASVINNLHPKQHPDLYRSIAKAFAALVPLLEDVLYASAVQKKTGKYVTSVGCMRAVFPPQYNPEVGKFFMNRGKGPKNAYPYGR